MDLDIEGKTKELLESWGKFHAVVAWKEHLKSTWMTKVIERQACLLLNRRQHITVGKRDEHILN